tara:strand:- start:1135 stop:1422 length:288 start_codon:yes stop_codon:yes gene_type:complete
MDWQSLALPGATTLVAIGISFGTLQASAADSEDLSDRVQNIEIDLAKGDTTKVMVKQNTERLERLEAVVIENAKQLNKLSQDMAAVCQATGARCR